MEIENIEIKWLGHSGFLIRNSTLSGVSSMGGKIIYIDPYNIGEQSEKADLILLTHGHYDHCSVADIEKVVREGTRIIAPVDCQSKIARFKTPVRMEVIEPGQELNLGNIKIVTLPAYNIDKPFHSKEEGGVGYLIKMNEVTIYHSGDTDVIPEMQKLTGYSNKKMNFVALLPVGGRFTMSAEEAFDAVKLIKPSLAIPMHYGSIVGSREDAEEFVELCSLHGFKAQILDKK